MGEERAPGRNDRAKKVNSFCARSRGPHHATGHTIHTDGTLATSSAVLLGLPTGRPDARAKTAKTVILALPSLRRDARPLPPPSIPLAHRHNLKHPRQSQQCARHLRGCSIEESPPGGEVRPVHKISPRH